MLFQYKGNLMNNEHILLSNFPSCVNNLGTLNAKGETVNKTEFRYLGFIDKKSYPDLLQNSMEKFFISLILYKKIYISDKDFLEVLKVIGIKDALKLLERKVVNIIYRHEDPHVIVHRSTNPLITKIGYEIQPIKRIGSLHYLEKNYQKFSVDESYKSKIIQYFENAHVNLDDMDEDIYLKNITFLKGELQNNINNLSYKDTFQTLRLYEIIDSFLLQDKHGLTNSLVDEYGQKYLESKFVSINKDNALNKINLFSDISARKRIPNFYHMYQKGSLEIDDFLDMRESFDSQLFRYWFLNADNSDEEIFYQLLKNHKTNIATNLIKWIIPTIIGVLNTPLGIASSAVENFFISKILQGWHPNFFLDDVLSNKLNNLEGKFEFEKKSKIIRERVKGIQRNDLCPCQSGKKFKKCHGINM